MKLKALGSKSVNGTSSGVAHAPRGRDFSYFGLFSILGDVWLSFNALRGCLVIFSLRGSLAIGYGNSDLF